MSDKPNQIHDGVPKAKPGILKINRNASPGVKTKGPGAKAAATTRPAATPASPKPPGQ